MDERLAAHLQLAALTDEAFVERAFELLLRRPPDNEARGHALAALAEHGLSRAGLLSELAESEEEIFSTGLILSVTTKVTDRASVKPSEYAHDLLASAQEEGDGAKLEKSQEGPLECLRLEYTIESDEGNIKVINLAKANDATGTLYFATWQSAEKEESALKPVRDAVLSSMKLDPSF